jgi:hypothetical protein
MRVIVTGLLLLVLAAGCGGSSPGPREHPRVSADDRIPEPEARLIAEETARRAGWDLEVYGIVSVDRADGRWRVSFEHAPPAPPGGHFTVYVDASTGEAELIPGR